MRLSSKSRYAVMAMMDLALHERSGPVTLTDIAESQGISLSYLEQLFSKLRKFGLVEGMRGPGGGYRLARPANDITIAEVIAGGDEQAKTISAPGVEETGYAEPYLTHELWMDLSQRIFDFLDEMTLADFCAQPDAQDAVRKQDELYRWNWNQMRRDAA